MHFVELIQTIQSSFITHITMKFDITTTTKNVTRGTNSCTYIVLHHTWWGSFDWNLKTLTVWAVSCHYLLGQDWKLAKIGNDENILRHCGDSQWEGKKMMNPYCIGIEIINDWYNFTDIQRAKVRELVKYLMIVHNIPSKNIIRHKDIAPTRKVDIYDTFRNNEYKTFTDYQNSFNNVPWIEEAKIALTWNSNLRNKTNDVDLKVLLSKTNTYIRKLYNLQ